MHMYKISQVSHKSAHSNSSSFSPGVRIAVPQVKKRIDEALQERGACMYPRERQRRQTTYWPLVVEHKSCFMLNPKPFIKRSLTFQNQLNDVEGLFPLMC